MSLLTRLHKVGIQIRVEYAIVPVFGILNKSGEGLY